MLKFIKYEIKGSYKFILGLLAMLGIAFTIIQSKAANELKNFMGFESATSIMNPFELLSLLSILVIVGGFITAFFFVIGSFRKELYEDRGYLTFTLPLSGNQILGGKLIVAIFWYLLISGAAILYNALLSMILFDMKWTKYLGDFLEQIGFSGLSIVISGILSAVLTLIIIYFSMALSKVSFKNKKIGGLWFVLFLIINGLVSYIVARVNLALPFYLDLTSFRILGQSEMSSLYGMMGMPGGMSLTSGILFGFRNEIFLNVVGTLAQVIIGLGMFLATGYLLEKKIDL